MSCSSARLRAPSMAVLSMIVASSIGSQAFAQNNGGAAFVSRAVGGISIDAEGVLNSAQRDDSNRLREQRAGALQEIPGDLNQPAELRKVSLRLLEAALAEHVRNGTPLSDDIRYLAGLQRIRYVFVYPEYNDVVLAGYGEGWTVDEQGSVVGVKTGRPVLLLDDLLVALRTSRQAAQGGITCSIDPTAEGLVRLQGFVANLASIGRNPSAVIDGIQQVLGPQTITVTGVPETSHFARVLVAADYKMKRLAMNFDPAPVAGLPSYLHMIKNSRGLQNMLPRWWLATNYDPLLTDADGLAWELRGTGVIAMTEDSFLAADGSRTSTGKSSPLAQKWADNMTAKYEELSVKDPIFGQLRNCMDLAVVAALITKENLTEKAGYSMPLLLDDSALPNDEYLAPRQVDTKASFIETRSKYIISASGGVMIHSWGVADEKETSDSLAPLKTAAGELRGSQWWWN